ncbi:MAG: HAD family hydrolase, partial [Comamonadaceae bacterium]
RDHRAVVQAVAHHRHAPPAGLPLLHRVQLVFRRAVAAHDLGRDAGHGRQPHGCAPEDKLHAVQQWQAGGRRVAMVGDGLNDGPVIAQADASFAFGQAVPLTQARADFVVLADDLSAIPQAVAQARLTLRVVRQNLAWAAAYNLLSVPFALAGLMPAWLAGLGMAASSVGVVLNSARVARNLPPMLPAADAGTEA